MPAQRAIAAVTLWLPSIALACPVCGGSASDASQGAYIDMSIVLSALPLVAIGGLVAWVALKMRGTPR